jgi:hypothetical protein
MEITPCQCHVRGYFLEGAQPPASPQPLIIPEPAPGILTVGKGARADMEHRKSRHFWLKLAAASVSYSVVASSVGLYWYQHISPAMLGDGLGTTWALFVSAIWVFVWAVLPSVLAFALLRRYYGRDYFLLLWPRPKFPGDFGARALTMLVSAASSSLSIWLVAGLLWGPFSPSFAFHMVFINMILAGMLNDGVVRAERTAAENRVAQTKEATA